MIEACKTAEEATALSKAGQRMFDQIEASAKPIVAAVYGQCLGGGLEVRRYLEDVFFTSFLYQLFSMNFYIVLLCFL